MSMQDPIADMLTRIRNAQMARFPDVSMPSSKMKVSIAKVLKAQGYISDYSNVDGKGAGELVVQLRYYNGKPVIEKIKRISSPGLRVHKGYENLPRVMGGMGTAIISTSRGLMTDHQARSARIGGEVICIVE